MDELKNKLMEQLGLDADASGSAIEIVLGFVKDKLPENMQGMVDSIANGETPDLGNAGGLMDMAKGIFGGDK